VLDKAGQIMMLRPNHVIAPTNLEAVRQTMLAAIDQAEVVNAVMGADPENGTSGVGFLATGNKEVDDAGLDVVRERHSRDEIKAMLDRSGYAGEKLVLLHATDHIFFNPMGAVVAAMLTEAGMAVDDQAMDWPTVQTRRISKEPLDKGGWSMFPSVVAVTARTVGSAGRPIREWRKFMKPGLAAPIPPSRRDWNASMSCAG
jgi:peptide/nickel transport system substrate-binding protein